MSDDTKKDDAAQARDRELLTKAQQISTLPKKQQKDAVLAVEQAADAAHVARAAQEAAEKEAAEKAEAEQAAELVKAKAIIGESKDALLARLKERHGDRFSHELEVDKETGDLILHSLVLLGPGEKGKVGPRVSTARRIPRAQHEEMSRDEVAALEVDQLHVLAQRVGC